MARITVDSEHLLKVLLQEAFPGVEVRPEPDVDAVDVLPMLIFACHSGRMVSNGAPGLGWSWQVDVRIIADTHQHASDLADDVYGVMHGFDDRQASVPNVGFVSSTEDVAMPTRTATVALPAGGLTQFDGSWLLIIQPHN